MSTTTVLAVMLSSAGDSMTGLEAIRVITGIFEPKGSVDRLALVNLIARGMLGEAEKDYVKETILKVFDIDLDL